MSITLLELRTRARQMADMEDSEFVTDSELNNYINFAAAELHDILVSTYGSEYFLESTTATTTNGQQAYDLPTNFYKLRGVDAKINSQDWINIRPFNFNERNRYEDFGAWTLMGISNVRYRIMGNSIRFTPTPDNNIEYRLWYVPKATVLSDDSDTLDDINQYSDFVIITAAMKMRAKEESEVTLLASERNRILERLKDDAQNRDAAQPESISDIHAEHNEYHLITSRG